METWPGDLCLPHNSKESAESGQQHFRNDGSTLAPWRQFVVPAVLVLAAAAALGIDMPIARALRTWNESPAIHAGLSYFDMFEMFGHGAGVIVLVLVMHQLDRQRRWAIPRVLLCALAAGGLADLLKLIVLRVRPYEFRPFELGLDSSVWSTFNGWFPALTAGSPGQSFPSAHTATAVGFAAALIWVYPQGQRLFCILAILVGCQRIVCGAHYPSDVLIGAAAGWVVAQLFLNVGLAPGWFARLERRWKPM